MLTCVVHPGLKAQKLVARNSLSLLLLSEVQCLCDVCMYCVNIMVTTGRASGMGPKQRIAYHVRLYMSFFFINTRFVPCMYSLGEI